MFAQAIESMSYAPPSSMIPHQYEPQPFNNIPGPSPFQQSPQAPFQQPPPQAPFSLLQRAIQQSDQQFNTNSTPYPMSNGFTNAAPFQPFDLIGSNAYPGFPIGPVLNQTPPHHQPPPPQQQSPIQPNNIRLSSPQAASSPLKTSQASPPTQPQTPQQTNSPRMPGGSTLQFVPSQVLRNMPKNNK